MSYPVVVTPCTEPASCHTCSASAYRGEHPVDAFTEVRFKGTSATTVIVLCPACLYAMEVGARLHRKQGR